MIITPAAPGKDYGFFNTYMVRVADNDLIAALKENIDTISSLVSSLTEEQLNYRYEAGKWTVKEIISHLCDAERNNCYRAMRFARADQSPLPAFNPQAFMENSFTESRTIESIMTELKAIRNATIAFYEGLHPIALDREGPARDVTISVRSLGFLVVGHARHHLAIIHERYLEANN